MIIDQDYYDNQDNEGHIYIQLLNLSPLDIQIKKGDIIAQGIIKPYLITEDDNAFGERLGGFGSTSEC
jgi:dUTP pyrophosphatase